MRSRIDHIAPEYRRWSSGAIYFELTRKGEYRGNLTDDDSSLDAVRKIRDLCNAVLLDMDPMGEARHGS